MCNGQIFIFLGCLIANGKRAGKRFYCKKIISAWLSSESEALWDTKGMLSLLVYWWKAH